MRNDNAKKRGISPASYMCLAPFQQGLLDKFLEEPYPKSYEKLSRGDQILYEHGRQWAAISGALPGKKIAPQAAEAFWQAYSTNTICR